MAVKLPWGTILSGRNGRQLKVVGSHRSDGTVILDDGRRLIRVSWGVLQRQIDAGQFGVRKPGVVEPAMMKAGREQNR